jgi:hypothetical protein
MGISAGAAPEQGAGAAEGSIQQGLQMLQTPLPRLVVSGGINAVVGPQSMGVYEPIAVHHGRPVYQRCGRGLLPAGGRLEIRIYFWQDQNYPRYSGWWIGPTIGGSEVFAHNRDEQLVTTMPPHRGWRVPWYGNDDEMITVRAEHQVQSVAITALMSSVASTGSTVPPVEGVRDDSWTLQNFLVRERDSKGK